MNDVLESTEAAIDMFEGTADSGNETTTVSDTAVIDVASDMGVDAELVKEFAAGDEEFAALLKGDGNKSGSEDNASGDTPDEDSAAGSDANEDATPSADDKIPAGKSDEPPMEFTDNVIDGLSGKELSKLSDDAKVALANFYSEVTAKAAAAEKAKARINRLLEDPVVNARATAIEAGRSADLQVRRLTVEDKKNFAAAIQDKVSLDDSEVEEILSALGGSIESVAQEMAQGLASRSITVQESMRVAAEVQKQGNELLRSLAEYNKSLALQETDLTKFYKFTEGAGWGYNEAHPEIEKFKNGIGKISAWAGEHEIDYRKAVKMGAKAFYAAAAAALDMPVALNTKERDTKIAAAAKQKALTPFLKSAKSNTLNTQGTDSTVNRSAAAGVVRDGFDITRLATDDAYFDAAISRKWGDVDWAERVQELAAQGRALVNK